MTESGADTSLKRELRAGRRLVLYSSAGAASWDCDGPTTTVIVGRDAAANLYLDDPSMSRRHAAVHLGSAVEIEDLGSRNGTIVGGIKLAPEQRVRLRSGAPVELGDAMLMLMEPEHEQMLGAEPLSLRGRDLASPEMERVHRLVDLVARGTISVIVYGETGVGKEGTAERIHRASARREHPFVAVNCAALSETLLESELFGHEKGAFTGAVNARVGILESANKGTVFLDELGEMPASVQVKLLRCIEKKEIVPVGGVRPRPIDVRFVAATHRDLEALIDEGKFRADLYFRLNGMTIEVPPLRERPSQIVPLARGFVAESARAMGMSGARLTPAAERVLLEYSWPGNIRELKNAMERAVLLANGGPIDEEHVMLDKRATRRSISPAVADETSDSADPGPELSPEDARERARIVDALKQTGGNQTHAAKLLGMSRFMLMKRMNDYELTRPRPRKT